MCVCACVYANLQTNRTSDSIFRFFVWCVFDCIGTWTQWTFVIEFFPHFGRRKEKKTRLTRFNDSRPTTKLISRLVDITPNSNKLNSHLKNYLFHFKMNRQILNWIWTVHFDVHTKNSLRLNWATFDRCICVCAYNEFTCQIVLFRYVFLFHYFVDSTEKRDVKNHCKSTS